MKFTKEQAIQELKSQLAQKVEKIDNWSRTITENVDTLCSILGDDSEIELSDFVAKCVPLFVTTQGFVRKEKSDLAKEYEDKLKNVKPKQEPSQEPKLEDALEQRIKALEKELAESKSKAEIGRLRGDIKARLSEKGVKNNGWTDDILGTIAITEGMDVDATVDRLVGIYNKYNSQTPPDVTPKKTSGERSQLEDRFKAAHQEYLRSHPELEQKS